MHIRAAILWSDLRFFTVDRVLAEREHMTVVRENANVRGKSLVRRWKRSMIIGYHDQYWRKARFICIFGFAVPCACVLVVAVPFSDALQLH